MSTTQRLRIAELEPLMEHLAAGHRGLDHLIALLQSLKIRIDLPDIDVSQLELSFSGHEFVLRRRKKLSGDDNKGIFDTILAHDARTRVAVGLARSMALSDAAVLIQGATGAGKNLLGRAIHYAGPRSREPFVKVPCALLNSPGNQVRPADFIAEAGNGTLVFDDIEDLDRHAQDVLLSQLQESTACRMITLTRSDLIEQVRQGRFLQKLLDCLCHCHIELPDLRERGTDIELLARYHCDRLCARKGLETKQLDPEYLQILGMYSWPGNVRELINTLDQSLMAARDQKTLYVKDLPAHIRIQTLKTAAARKKGR